MKILSLEETEMPVKLTKPELEAGPLEAPISNDSLYAKQTCNQTA